MRNPFKKNEEDHDDIYDILYNLSNQVITLGSQVADLREEVDFLVDELDD